MKIKVFNLHKQIGNGKGDVYDWTSKQVTIENGILQSNDGGTSSTIIKTKNIPNKNVTIYVTDSGSVYVTSTEQPHRSHGIAGAAQHLVVAAKPPAAPITELTPQLRKPYRVPSANPLSGQILVSDLQTRNDYLVNVANLSAPFQGIKDKKLVKDGLEAIIIDKDLNYNTVYKMLRHAGQVGRDTFKELNHSKEWWNRVFEILNKKK